MQVWSGEAVCGRGQVRLWVGGCGQVRLCVGVVR